MTQQTSPFIEGKYGWALGEGNWNLGMDENLLKFSYLFDRNIDGIVSSLPAAVNGTAYFNTTDNRIYFVAGGVYSSTPVPKWFEVTLRSSGQVYQFDGTTLNVGSSGSSLKADLAETASPNKNSGLIGYNPALIYPSNTVGSAIGWIDSRTMGLLADGSDETAKLLAAVAALKNTGKTLRIATGTVRITAAVTIEGMTLSLSDTAQIELNGSVSTPFNGGGIIVGIGAVLEGGTVFTSGAMIADSGTKTIRQLAGRITGVTVYSQLDECVNHTGGYLDVMMYGGKSRGVRSQPSVNAAYTFKVRWYNIGIRYVNKVAVAGVPTDSRAFHFFPQTTITYPVRITIQGDHSWKNGAWIGGTTFQATDVVIHDSNISRSGYYINESGVEVAGSGAGTAIEIENCPNAKVVNCVTTRPGGYNVAFVGGSHGAKTVDGLHIGGGGDPVVVIVNTNDTDIGGVLIGGTVGVSVGEGTAVNNTRVTAEIRDMTAAPITFFAGKGLFLQGANISGEQTLSSFTGSWTGPGEVKAAVIVYEGANDVTMDNTSIQGWFTHDIIDRSSIAGRLRVNRSGGSYSAPIINRDDTSLNRFSRQGDSAKFTRVINDTDATGHAFVGEFSLPGSGAAFNSLVISPSMTDMTNFDVTGTDLATVRSRYAILIYMKFVAGALGNRIGFSLQDGTGVTPQSPEIFYSPFGVAPTPSTNSIQGVLHNLAADEWVPIVIPLNNIIYSGSNPAALTRFLVWKRDNAATYDLTITKPVLIYIGTTPK